MAMITAAGLNVVSIALVNLDAFSKAGVGADVLSVIGDFFVLKAWILAIALFIAIKKIKLHPIVFIAISAVIGIIFKF